MQRITLKLVVKHPDGELQLGFHSAVYSEILINVLTSAITAGTLSVAKTDAPPLRLLHQKNNFIAQVPIYPTEDLTLEKLQLLATLLNPHTSQNWSISPEENNHYHMEILIPTPR